MAMECDHYYGSKSGYIYIYILLLSLECEPWRKWLIWVELSVNCRSTGYR